MSAEDIKYLVLHCSATRCNQDYTEEMLLRDHLARHFRGIGYHFYIRKDGRKTQHRMLLEVGAHCVPYNRCSIGICYEGGLDEEGKPCNTMTPQQKERITDLLINLHWLFPKAKIVGHRDLPGTTPKECPCLDAHKLFGWIENFSPSNSPDTNQRVSPRHLQSQSCESSRGDEAYQLR